MLQVEQLTVSHGRILAVAGLTLAVDEGETVALIGPNGAGKTTTLSTIVGLLRPDAGAIRFQGRSLIGLPPERIARLGVSLVPESRQIFSTLTVRENLLLGTRRERSNGNGGGDAERVLDRFPVLREYYRTPAGRLSGGEQQQLAIARALLRRPRLLLLDEPSLGLAPIMIDRVFELLAELRASGMTILLVEQNARRTIAFADRTYVLRSGRLILSGTREQLQGESVADAYFGIPA